MFRVGRLARQQHAVAAARSLALYNTPVRLMSGKVKNFRQVPPKFNHWTLKKREIKQALPVYKKYLEEAMALEKAQRDAEIAEAKEFNAALMAKREAIRTKIKSKQAEIHRINMSLAGLERQAQWEYGDAKRAIRDDYLHDRRKLLMIDIKNQYSRSITQENFNEHLMDAFLFPPNYIGVDHADITAPGDERTKFYMRNMLPESVAGRPRASASGSIFKEPYGLERGPDPRARLTAEESRSETAYNMTGVDYVEDVMYDMREEGGFDQELDTIEKSEHGLSPEQEARIMETLKAMEGSDLDGNTKFADLASAEADSNDVVTRADLDELVERSRQIPSDPSQHEKIAAMINEAISFGPDGSLVLSSQAPNGWPEAMAWPPQELLSLHDRVVREGTFPELENLTRDEIAQRFDKPANWTGEWPPTDGDIEQWFTQYVMTNTTLEGIQRNPDGTLRDVVMPQGDDSSTGVAVSLENIDTEISSLRAKLDSIETELASQLERELSVTATPDQPRYDDAAGVEVGHESDEALSSLARLTSSLINHVASDLGVDSKTSSHALTSELLEVRDNSTEAFDIRRALYKSTLDHVKDMYEARAGEVDEEWSVLPRAEQIEKRDTYLKDALLAGIPQEFKSEIAAAVFNTDVNADPLSVIHSLFTKYQAEWVPGTLGEKEDFITPTELGVKINSDAVRILSRRSLDEPDQIIRLKTREGANGPEPIPRGDLDGTQGLSGLAAEDVRQLKRAVARAGVESMKNAGSEVHVSDSE